MAERFGEIGAAVPLRALAIGRLEEGGREEQLSPGQHANAHIEGEGQLVFAVWHLGGRDPMNEGPQCLQIVLLDPGIGVERHGGIEVSPVGADAVMQRILEIGIAPSPDAGLRIGGDVDRIDRPERGMDGKAAAIGF
jgi:hypothetical protein